MDSLPIPSPDFTSLSEDLKTWLKTRPELTDYDFDGSVINTVIGLLAYNTTMNAFYLNQVANEAYLETSSQRSSAIMNAQDLGYEVTSKTSASAVIRLTLTESTPTANTFITLPVDSAVFTASVNNKSFTFRSLTDVYMPKDINGKYVADIKVVEGKQFIHTKSVTQTILDNGFDIENVDVDTNTISVIVDGATYTKSNNIVSGVDSDSQIFFVSDKFGNTNVRFGDGIVGKVPSIGNTMVIKYLKSSGDLANDIGAFNFIGSYAGTTATVETIVAASGGANEETIDSIKFNAPKWFESQGRCVTEDDYRVMVNKLFGNLSDVVVWGGEKNDPPVYGKVFLSIKPQYGYYLTDADKTEITEELQKYNVVTIFPEIVDPDYVFVDVNASVEYKQSLTQYTQATISDIVKTAIRSYSDTELGKFSSAIRYSQITNVLLGADSSIQSGYATLNITKRIEPIVGDYSDISIAFKNSLKPYTLTSSKFTFNSFANCYFVDDGVGNIQLADYTSGNKVVVNQYAGTVDYVTGNLNIERTYLVSVDPTLVDDAGDVYMTFSATSGSFDINTSQKNILVIDKITVTSTKV